MKENEFNSTKKAREIVQVILDFGVSQNDILNIIRKLSLELEDIEVMKKISSIINKEEDLNKIQKIHL